MGNLPQTIGVRLRQNALLVNSDANSTVSPIIWRILSITHQNVILFNVDKSLKRNWPQTLSYQDIIDQVHSGTLVIHTSESDPYTLAA